VLKYKYDKVVTGGDFMPTQTYLNLPKEKQDRIFNAAVDEFSVRTFNEAKISNIIKSAEIARGSFYQYFDDKKDLLLYLFDIIGNQKIEYFGEDILNNINNIPFTTLFRELYKAGIMFALEHPKYVALMKNVIASKDDHLREMLQASKHKAIELYSFLIDKDKKEYKIRDDIDTVTLAQFVYDITINIATDQFQDEEVLDLNKMYEKADMIMSIFEKGVTKVD